MKRLDFTNFSQSQLFRGLISKDPLVLVDVGASGGINKKWDVLEGVIKVVGFEPDPEECKRLNEQSVASHTFLPTALYCERGKNTFHLTRGRRRSSLLEPNFALLEQFVDHENFIVEEQLSIECDTMENALMGSGIEDIDFLKLDTQGTELFILQGAEKYLSDIGILGIFVELEFSPMYQDQPLFAEVDAFLRSKGFSLFDIDIPLGRKVRKTSDVSHSIASKGQVLWVHALYLKSSDEIESTVRTLEKALKFISIAELHQFSDVALSSLDIFHRNQIIDDDQFAEIKSCINKNKLFRPPELNLAWQIRLALVEYLVQRFPFIHKILRGIKMMIKGGR